MSLSALSPSRLRMASWLLLYLALFGAAMVLQEYQPGSLAAVTLYKAHLMCLGGWGGYWLDRALFPYDRPHSYLEAESTAQDDSWGRIDSWIDSGFACRVPSSGLHMASLRRAVVVAACLICVGLGA